MRKHLLVAGIAVATLLPTLALAQETCEQRSANRTAGTVVGGVAGALLGSAVAGHGEKGAGAAIGGVGGAIAGNQLARGDRDCTHAYGYYDNNARWHANQATVFGHYDADHRWRADGDQQVASGYYDRHGDWVDGQPNGYYDSRGEWVAHPANGYDRRGGYRDRAGTWDIDTQISRLDDRIERGRNDGSLSRRESYRARLALNSIRQDEQNRRNDGSLSDRDQSRLQARLDRLTDEVRLDRQN